MVDAETYAEVVQAGGSLSKLARALGDSRQVVNNWRYRGFPVGKCRAIEEITGISVKRLRPHDWRLYWPDADRTTKRRAKVPA